MISLIITSLLVIVAASALLFVGAQILVWLELRDRVLLTALVAVTYALVVVWEPRSWLITDVSVLITALVVGITIGATLRSGPAVIAFCVAAAFVDVVSFSGGLTRNIVESYRAGENRMLLYLSISFPVGGSVRAIVGSGDLAVLAALFSGFGRLGYGGWWSFAVPVLGLLLALGVGLAIGGAPALPFIGGATVVYVLFRMRQKQVVT
jgi:hypothetical protein